MSVSGRSTVAPPARDFDPFLKDLDEKKQSFRKNVVSLVADLKEVRSRLAAQEQSFAREIVTRQEAETKVKSMEDEVYRLQERLEERNEQLRASASVAGKYLEELDKLRVELSATQAMADASSASAISTQLQCLTLLKELDEKTILLKEHEDRVARLGEQLDDLEKNLGLKESSQKQLKDEILRIEHDIMEVVATVGANQDHELRRLMDEVSPRNIEKFNQLLLGKDEEIVKLKDEIRIMSAHWKLKTKEFESQLEKQRRADQELKKRVLKLEFCLQESRSQTRKLQRMEERRDRAIKDIRDRLASKEAGASVSSGNPKFWETSGFKIVVSMSMLVMVVFSRR